MSEDKFGSFIKRIRGGDAQAAEALVREYEAAIRLEVRMRLRDRRLRSVMDSMDVCQSVLGSFFLRAAAGQYELETPDQLIRLLVTITRNKVASLARRQRAQRRDERKLEALGAGAADPVAAGPSPSQMVAGEELLREFRRRLSPEERELAELRAEGAEWAEVAVRVGGTPQGRRKQLERAIERVARELQLEEDGDG